MNMIRRSLTVAVLALAFTAASASADSIDGFGVYTDDWGNNHTIKQGGSVNSGNIVGVWQSVLWADGALAGSGCSYVDGAFGTNTKNATIFWQAGQFPSDPSEWDGIVGPTTWGRADNYLLFTIYGVLVYEGAQDAVAFSRNGSGIYTWSWNGAYRSTGHPTPSLGC